jgi:hypothetical protein
MSHSYNIKGNIYELWHEDIWESGGIALSFLSSTLDEGEWLALATLTRATRPRNPLKSRIGGPQIQYGRCGEDKYLASSGNQTRTSEPVGRRYND